MQLIMSILTCGTLACDCELHGLWVKVHLGGTHATSVFDTYAQTNELMDTNRHNNRNKVLAEMGGATTSAGNQANDTLSYLF